MRWVAEAAGPIPVLKVSRHGLCHREGEFLLQELLKKERVAVGGKKKLLCVQEMSSNWTTLGPSSC